MREIWKDIQGYEGLYQVSNHGRVKSLGRIISKNKRGERFMPERILVPCLNSSGYYLVSLGDGRTRNSVYIHRIVANAFISNPNNLPEVNHKDENKANNASDNLEWCDRKYNANYGTVARRCAEANYKPVEMIRISTGVTVRRFSSAVDAELVTGICRNSISRACHGKYKTAGGYKWRFCNS